MTRLDQVFLQRGSASAAMAALMGQKFASAGNDLNERFRRGLDVKA